MLLLLLLLLLGHGVAAPPQHKRASKGDGDEVGKGSAASCPHTHDDAQEEAAGGGATCGRKRRHRVACQDNAQNRYHDVTSSRSYLVRAERK